jgi:ABC-2 type transport system permease protein
VRDVTVAVVSHDAGPPAVELIGRLRALESATRLIRVRMAGDEARAVRMVRDGEASGAVLIDPDYSAKYYRGEAGGAGFVVDNTDLFVAAALEQGLRQVVSGAPEADYSDPLEVIELFPFVNYLQYLVPGAVLAAVYLACVLSGGVAFVEDRAAGRLEGYLATTVRSSQIVGGLIIAASVKSAVAAVAVTPIAFWIAGCAGQLTLAPLGRVAAVVAVSSVTTASLMTALAIRLRTADGVRFLTSVTNMVLFFPSGALYPIEGFPAWLKAVACLDPFTYVVRSLRVVLFNSGDWAAVAGDLLVLSGIGVTCFLAAWAAVPRRL